MLVSCIYEFNFTMRVSVIIPSFNRVGLLPRAIDSVLNQVGAVVGECHFSVNELGSYKLEVIVIDDGSTDDTGAMMREKYPEVIYLRQDNLGVSAARNAAIKQASGDWIALLDSDDEWLPNKLVEQLSELKKTNLQVCHTEEIWIRNGVRVNQMKKHQKSGGSIFKHCLALCAMSPSSILLHSSVFEKVGLFDEALPACEDYDLWLRVAALYPVAYIEKPQIYKYGGHQDQLSRQYWGMDRFRVLALQKILSDDLYLKALSKEERDSAHTMLLKKIKILLKGAVKHDNHLVIEDCQVMLDFWSDRFNDEGVTQC